MQELIKQRMYLTAGARIPIDDILAVELRLASQFTLDAGKNMCYTGKIRIKQEW